MFFRRGNARFEDSLFIYLPGEVLITESIIIIAIFQDLPHRSVISSFYSLRSITEKLIDIRYFFFFGLSCSPRRTPPYIPCVRFMTLLFFTSIGPITTKKPVLSNDWTSIFTKKCRKGNTDRRSLSLFLLPI